MIHKFLKYYRFILLVSFLVLKYRVLILVLSDKALIQYLEARFESLKRRNSLQGNSLSRHVVTRRINAVLNRLHPGARCLVRSVVMNETLIRYGYTDQKIKFGVKFEENRLLAHAWMGGDGEYEKIYEL